MQISPLFRLKVNKQVDPVYSKREEEKMQRMCVESNVRVCYKGIESKVKRFFER